MLYGQKIGQFSEKVKGLLKKMDRAHEALAVGVKRRAIRRIEMRGDWMTQPSRFSQKSRPKVLAAIPCFNTKPFIMDVVLKAKKHVDEVIVVDDGSHDGTAEAAKDAGAFVISHKRNLGKGAAIRTAIQNTDADMIVSIDGDGQHDPDDIPKVIAPILRGEADLVIGSRHLDDSRIYSPPFSRRLTNILSSFTISAIVSFLLPIAISLNHLIHPSLINQGDPGLRTGNSRPRTRKWITDCTSGFRAIKKESWQKLDLVSQRFQIETEIIYEAARNKLVIAEVPISCNWNTDLSGVSIFRDGLRTLKLLSLKLIRDIRGI